MKFKKGDLVICRPGNEIAQEVCDEQNPFTFLGVDEEGDCMILGKKETEDDGPWYTDAEMLSPYKKKNHKLTKLERVQRFISGLQDLCEDLDVAYYVSEGNIHLVTDTMFYRNTGSTGLREHVKKTVCVDISQLGLDER